VHVTTDGGKNWTNVSTGIPGMPKWGTIRHIEVSNFDVNTAYVAVDAHYIGDFGAYLYKTTDLGKTWRRLEVKLPESNLNFINQIKEDPDKKGLLWMGTEKGLYFSPDDGKQWLRIKNNLPPVPINGITIQRNFKDLVIATYGRGIYILDDVTPFREFTEQVQQTDAHLFSVRPAYRFQKTDGIKSDGTFSDGQNPPYGANINYYLKDKQKDSVEVLVLNSKNETIQTIKTQNKPGIHRVYWDLRHQDFVLPKLLTTPKGKEWVPLNDKNERNLFIPDLDIGPGLTPTLVPPGNYTVVLKIGNKQFKQVVSVLKDPNTKGTEASIAQQYEQGIKLYTAINTSIGLIGEMEKMRVSLLKKSNDKTAIILEEKIYQLESKLFDVNQTGARWDIFRSGGQILERFLALGKEGIISSGDSHPTDQQVEVYNILKKQLDDVQAAFDLLKQNKELKKDKL
jgi:hypothetical protein